MRISNMMIDSYVREVFGRPESSFSFECLDPPLRVDCDGCVDKSRQSNIEDLRSAVVISKDATSSECEFEVKALDCQAQRVTVQEFIKHINLYVPEWCVSFASFDDNLTIQVSESVLFEYDVNQNIVLNATHPDPSLYVMILPDGEVCWGSNIRLNSGEKICLGAIKLQDNSSDDSSSCVYTVQTGSYLNNQDYHLIRIPLEQVMIQHQPRRDSSQSKNSLFPCQRGFYERDVSNQVVQPHQLEICLNQPVEVKRITPNLVEDMTDLQDKLSSFIDGAHTRILG